MLGERGPVGCARARGDPRRLYNRLPSRRRLHGAQGVRPRHGARCLTARHGSGVAGGSGGGEPTQPMQRGERGQGDGPLPLAPSTWHPSPWRPGLGTAAWETRAPAGTTLCVPEHLDATVNATLTAITSGNLN
jgi:hypothetical protein